MNLIITEVQISFIILMSLLVVALAYMLPQFSTAGKTFDRARKFLLVGTVLIAIHFMIQYALHKQIDDVREIRTTINLLFGIPISYLVYLSLIYLQCRGRLRRVDWLVGPVAYFGAVVCYIVLPKSLYVSIDVHLHTFLMSIFYAMMLCYYGVAMLRNNLHIERDIHEEGMDFYIPLVRWFRWPMYFMVLISLGFPVMTFNGNLLLRSLYGILAIISGFVYIFSFIGYGLNCKPRTDLSLERNVDTIPPQDADSQTVISDATEEDEDEWDEVKLKRMEYCVRKFILSEAYLTSGLTLKDVADLMHISRGMLRAWLKTTPYQKFTNWIVYLRIEKAKQLQLEELDLTSKEIAKRCGFCDRQYYQCQFKKLVGLSPAEWVKQHNKE